MAINLKELKLPPLSEAGMQVLDLLASDDIDFSYLGDFVAKDPLLSATMLKYANSPTYNRKVEVSNVRTAISILGLKTCKMAVSFAIMKSFDVVPTPMTEQLWSHSINTATTARIIAENLFPKLADDIETSALMHGMGALILARTHPKQYQDIFNQAMAKESPLEVNEVDIFGVANDEIIDVIASHLRLSDLTQRVIERIHSGEAIINIKDDVDRQRLIIYLAHFFLEKYDNLSCFKETIPNDMESLILLLNLTDDKLDQLYEDCEVMLNVL